MSKPRTSAPKPAPFPVGTRLKYVGKSDVSYGATGGEMVRVVYPGIEVTIDRCAYGKQGTGRVIDEDDDGSPIYDETRDFVSIYHVGIAGRCIDHEDACEWQIIAKAAQ